MSSAATATAGPVPQLLAVNPFQLQQLQLQHHGLQQAGQNQSTRPVIERGASWSYNETRILLSLWGQDMVQRQLTNSKRTRHVWEKIAERIREHGFERTADQVRTRVFNMIAEYRRILKNPTPERKKKCIFFDALHKIYQAKDTNGVKAALNNYEEDYNLEPIDFANSDDNNEGNGDDGSGNENEDQSEVFAYAMSPSQALSNGLSMNDGHSPDDEYFENSNNAAEETPLAANPAKRLRSESNLSSTQQLYQNFDNSASAMLIDRMFAHLAKETEVMREWVTLERERLTQEVTRRKEETEREERREKAFLATLTRMQEQMFAYLSKHTQQTHSSSAISSQSSPCNNGDEALESSAHHTHEFH